MDKVEWRFFWKSMIVVLLFLAFFNGLKYVPLPWVLSESLRLAGFAVLVGWTIRNSGKWRRYKHLQSVNGEKSK